MGLDMYLTAQKYFSGYVFRDDTTEKDVRDALANAAGLTVVNDDSAHGSATVSLGVAYWRKCNSIHAWFVKNVQDDVDDCKEYYVSRKNLEDLLDAAKTVKAEPSRGPDILPTQGGFFFGSTGYDEYYIQYDIDQTIDQISKVLEAYPEGSLVSFYYRASW